MRLAFYRSLSRQLDNAQGDELRRLTTTQAQPRRISDVARVSGTDNAHRRWLQRFVRWHGYHQNAS